ncbi:MAG: penicillin-binding protein 2 [Brevinematia bacterium]
MRKRIWVVFYIFLALVVVVIVRILTLVLPSEFEGEEKRKFTGRRGEIFDRNNNVLAVSYRTFSLWLDNSGLSQYERKFLVELMKDWLGLSYSEIAEKLRRESKFVWLVRKIPENEAENLFRVTNGFVSKFDKRVLGVAEEYVRRYPLGEKASGVVGAVNVDNDGISGFEYTFNDILLEKGGEGGKVVLTVDKYIQEITYLELARSVKEFDADLGIAVFAKKDGEILSIADYPSFDPNNLSVIPFSSRAVGYIIEPGSVMKLASVSFALINLSEIEKRVYECDGLIGLYGHTIKEKPHGVVSLENIIAHSCNIGMLKVIRDFDEKSFYFFLRGLGFGEKTLVGLPGEERGILRIFNEWSGVSKYMVGIGQEIGVTGMQLLKLGLILANDGMNIRPKLVKEILLSDGSSKTMRYSEEFRVIPSEVARKVRKYMRASVEYGTSKMAEIEGLRVGGKTGTGQIYNPEGGYYKDKYNAVFLGIVPYDDPKIIGVVILVNPKKLKQGGLSAGPTFRNILEKIVAYSPNLVRTQ